MPVKYLPYFPEPIEGQAILDNFVRTRRMLKYRGHNDVEARLRRGMPLYEVEEVEKVSGGGDNLVIRGECVSACAYLKDQGIKVDLVYIDPPFASGADYAKKIYLRKNPRVVEALAAGAELDDDELKAFEEKMYGDIWHKEQYLNWMYENLVAIRSVMSDRASIYVHLDEKIGHYVKVLLDEVFGESSFRSEIVWQKIRAVKAQSNSFGNVHDLIFHYAVSENEIFNTLTTEQDEDYESKFDRVEKSSGRRYQLVSMLQSGQGPERTFGDRVIKPPTGRHWIWSQERINKALEEGLIEFTSDGNGTPRKKQYLDESGERPMDDLWTDIFPLNSQSIERTGYSTQKPESLLDRVISASTSEGSIVADFFGGSGVASAVANNLERQFIHCDVGVNSVQTTRDRLIANGAVFNVLEIKNGVSLFRNPAQTMDRLKSLIQGLRNEDTLDSFWEGSIQETKNGMVPVYVPNLLDHSSKVLDDAAMARIIYEAMPSLPDDVVKVIVYYVDIEDRDGLEKFIKRSDTNIKIELRDLKEVLDNVVLGDVIEHEMKKVSGGFEFEIKSIVSDRLQQKIDEFNEKRRLQMQKKRQPLIEVAEIGEVEEEPEGGFHEITISPDGLELIEMVSLDCTNKDGSWKSDSEIRIDKNSYVIRDGKKTKDFWDGKITSKKKPLRLKVRNIAGDESIIRLI